MSTFLNGAAFVINYIIDMGASVMLPIIIAILSMLIGVKVGKAIRSGLMIGVGFVGMGLIVDMMNANMGPAAQAMADRLGVSLSIVEVGWTTTLGQSVGAVGAGETLAAMDQGGCPLTYVFTQLFTRENIPGMIVIAAIYIVCMVFAVMHSKQRAAELDMAGDDFEA